MAEVRLGNDTPISVTMNSTTPVRANVPDINYIPDYKIAEQERRANETIRQSNEETRQENEADRIALYEDLLNKVQTDYFKGDKGDTGATPSISANASITGGTGTPTVSVSRSGTDENPVLSFAFENLKGDKGDAGAIKFVIVQELPETGADDTIYLLPITPDTSGNNYAEYIYINGAWELLGKIGVQVDLTDYVKNTDYATSSKGGVVKSNDYYNGLVSSAGTIYCNTNTYATYGNKDNNAFISKGTLENVITGKQLVNQSTLNTSQATQDTRLDALEEYTSGDATTESEGTSLTITNSLKAPFDDISLKGQTSQTTSILPSEYTQVEYIQSDETNVINTSVPPSTEVDIEVDIGDITTNNQFGSPAGYRNGNTNQLWWYVDPSQNNRIAARWGDGSYTTNYYYTSGERIKVRQNKNGLYINGTLSTNAFATATISGSYNIYLFACNNNNSSQWQVNAKIYEAKIWVSGTLKRHFIPCYRNNDNAVGMFDIVNGTFYSKQGNSEFTKGANVTLPTPSYPQDVNVVSGDNEINICGKNLFKGYDNMTSGFLPSSGSYPTTNSSFPNARYQLIELKAGQSITTSNSTNLQGRLRYIDKDTNQVIGSLDISTNNYYETTASYGDGFKSGTITAKKDFIIGVMLLQEITQDKDFMVEKGSTATTYEPYTGNTYPISLGNKELCKIGDYQDYFYKENKKWYKYQTIYKIVLGGSESWWLARNTTPYVFATNINNYLRVAENTSFCTHFQSVVNGTYGSMTDGQVKFRYYNDSANNLYMCTSVVSDASNFKSWLANNNVTIYYILNTPTTEEITDTTLLEQLEAIYDGGTYKGTTNINQENNDLPFVLDVTTFNNNLNGQLELLHKLIEG